MNLTEKIKNSIDKDIEKSREKFMDCIRTDENADYRRGFLAGELFARLHFKCAFRELCDAQTE